MKSLSLFFVFVCLFIVFQVSPSSAECITCKNKTVCLDASKGQTVYTCGRPLSISRDESETTGKEVRYGNQIRVEYHTIVKETWTYVTDGCYRYLYFEGDRLRKITDGSTAN